MKITYPKSYLKKIPIELTNYMLIPTICSNNTRKRVIGKDLNDNEWVSAFI